MMGLFRREARQAEPSGQATDAVIDHIVARASGSELSRPETLAVTEIAAGFAARAFAAARFSGMASALVTPSDLALLARSLVKRGESLATVSLGDRPSLRWAATWDVSGGSDPDSWIYRCDFSGPSGFETRRLPAMHALHFRVNVDPERPWRGQSPLTAASATARTAADAEKTAGAEARVPVSRLIPIAGSQNPEQQSQSANWWAKRLPKGGFFTIPLKATASSRSASTSRAHHDAVHPDPSTGHVALRKDAGRELLEALGVPCALVDAGSDAAGQREAYRRFLHISVEPMARVVESEFLAKLGLELSLSFSGLFAGDLQGRTRGVKQLVDSNVDLERAMRLTGLAE